MDTGTHFAMGFGLAGLAYLDPTVASQPELANAVLLGTILGSQAPDIDTVLKLKGNAIYIRNHRGNTHSFPAVLIWGGLISAILYAFSPGISFLHLFLWTLLAVMVHVGMDIFNAYGTQVTKPVNKKWLSLNTINIFDPFIMGIHVVGFILWKIGYHPGHVFAGIYAVMIVYMIQRVLAYRSTIQYAQNYLGIKGRYTLLPSLIWGRWRLIVENDQRYYVGQIKNKEIILHDSFDKHAEKIEPVLEKAKKDKNISAFLSFSRYAHVTTNELEYGYEVKWIDLRYRTKTHYAFIAIAHLDKQLNILDSYTGWEYREHKISEKLVYALDENYLRQRY
ncbi:MAG TPA: hypothetical protein DDY49_13925 [Paenibacillaceae bacterium]|nr:hypothetical protein [Paenibacillaceae bacterium]